MALVERSQVATIPAVLAHRATVDPERAFLLSGDARLTFGEADGQADALAAGLHSLGVEAGDRIALLLPPCPEFAVAMFAAAKLGAVVVPLNPRMTGPELQYLVTVGKEDLWYDDRIFQYEDLISSGRGRDYDVALTPADGGEDEVFGLLYTSGTTGKPKGVLLTHGNIVRTAAATAEALGLRPEDRAVGVSALFHVFGLGPGVIGALVSGSTLILDSRMDGARVLDLVEKHRATVEYGTPTLFETQLREQAARPRDLSSLRLCFIAGAPVPDGLPARVERELGSTAVIGYSLTEASSVVSLTRADDAEGKRHLTVGRPLPGVEIRILADSAISELEELGELPPESVGEISVRGTGTMRGYYRQPRLTTQSLDPDGFYRTGDLGMMDDSGYLHLVGRHREVIIRSGYNVHPRELEDRLHMHPAVQDVAVVGLPDAITGESICACVVPIEGAIVTEDELRDWCRATLAEHKIPDRVRLFDGFPMTGTGKVRRVEVARLAREAVFSDT